MTQKLIIVHWNQRKNGGNLLLKKFADEFSEQLGLSRKEIILEKDMYAILYVLSTRNLLIWSNPLITILLFWKKNSIIFIQSNDEELFSSLDFGNIKTFIYKYLIRFALKYHKSNIVFNSDYTKRTYNNLKSILGVYPSIDSLYWKSKNGSISKDVKKRDRSCVWIGTRHTRKGFSDLLTIAHHHKKYNFICIFSGQVPKIKNLPLNVEIFQNIEHSAVLRIISECEISISTSQFESLNLPIYEGLLGGNIILAKSSDYIYSNGLSDYVNTYENANYVDLAALEHKKQFKLSNPRELISQLVLAYKKNA